MVDLLFLSDLDIRECNGCHVCWEGRECSKGDDMNDVYPQIIQSDIMIFGTPVYWYGPTALIKAFMDRFVYFNCPQNRASIRGKSAVVAVPFEEEDPGTATPVITWFERCLQYLEMDLAATITVPGVTRKGDILAEAGLLKKARELGRSLAVGPPHLRGGYREIPHRQDRAERD